MEISREHLEHLLEASQLLQAPAALQALRAGASLANSGNAVDGLELRNTYCLRADRMSEKRSEHARQLVASMEEFCRSKGGPVTFLTVKPAAEHEFLIFWCPSDDSLVGCQKTVGRDAVSAERWEELWGEPIPLERVEGILEILRAEVRRTGCQTVRISRRGLIECTEAVQVHPRLVTALLNYLQVDDPSEVVELRNF